MGQFHPFCHEVDFDFPMGIAILDMGLIQLRRSVPNVGTPGGLIIPSSSPNGPNAARHPIFPPQKQPTSAMEEKNYVLWCGEGRTWSKSLSPWYSAWYFQIAWYRYPTLNCTNPVHRCSTPWISVSSWYENSWLRWDLPTHFSLFPIDNEP